MDDTIRSEDFNLSKNPCHIHPLLHVPYINTHTTHQGDIQMYPHIHPSNHHNYLIHRPSHLISSHNPPQQTPHLLHPTPETRKKTPYHRCINPS
ncbi:hypothetical protein P153DRAFT_7321 [Dothidotthia symphoricarpi CBS 119687]|uniref:Uncharacterized protein n=1 Tax=Dothidotthia symphoricarpi CBS 119687 TaxID=1392245 RepID=A0A6A6ATZ0_9PLEO|nr:uncharacterized protein P153DRAFT_7321 [Dothidotthia symphoricarpi CBS 119687]KAF2134673.1 hypothetical protein P153DRAFT_7321 [Dothidotthia symphoricarpi CBS 119687]